VPLLTERRTTHALPVHWFGAYEGYELKAVGEPFKVRSDQAGFEQVTAVINGLLKCGRYHQLVLGHEPTGIYHEAWSRALAERYAPHCQGQAKPGLVYQFLNPLLSKRKREELTKGRKRKTDKIDLKAIAYCLRDGLGQAAFLASERELGFQLWGQAYRQNQRERRRLSTALLAQLDRLWPGAVVNLKRFRKMHPELEAPVPLVRSKPLERKRVQAILEHCPNPHHFLALGQAGIQAFFRTHIGRCGAVTANMAYNLVKNALLPPPEIAVLLAAQLQSEFGHYLALAHRFEQLANQAEQLVPHSPAAVLTSVPGISPLLAARYLAHLGHPQRFKHPKEIWAFAGFDVVTEESGDFRRVGHITKKGAPGLRDTLYLIGLHTARNVPAIGRVKQKALARGKGDVAATIHAAHKANRICQHLLYHQLPFDPDRCR
jgi:transposase